MADPMTDARLDEISALADQATPGPWEIAYDHDDRPDTGQSVQFPTAIGPFTWIEHPTAREDADSVFVAAARTDIPELVAEVRRLRAQVAELDERDAWLSALEQAGVDNWDGCSVAADILAEFTAKEA